MHANELLIWILLLEEGILFPYTSHDKMVTNEELKMGSAQQITRPAAQDVCFGEEQIVYVVGLDQEQEI